MLDTILRSLAFRSLVFLSEDRLGINSHPFQVWDLKNRKLVATHEGPPWMSPVMRSPDGRFLLFRDCVVRTETFELVFKLPLPEKTLWCADWSPDGRRLAYGMDGGTLLIWDLAPMHERLAAVGLSWESPGFRDLAQLEPVSQLLAMKLDESQGRDFEKWDATYRDIAELASAAETASESLSEYVDWLTLNLGAERTRSFVDTEVPETARRIEQLANLANTLKKRDDHQLAERLLLRTIQFTKALEERDPSTLLALSYVHHTLADLYHFQMSDRLQAAVEAYEEEHQLIQTVVENDRSMAAKMPLHRSFWMNHNYAMALSKSGERILAIQHLDKALAVNERNPQIASSFGGLPASYRNLIDWLKAENRNADAQAVLERARKVGALEE